MYRKQSSLQGNWTIVQRVIAYGFEELAINMMFSDMIMYHNSCK